MSARFEGTVKWFNEEKGYGFIRQGGSQDIFLHISAIKDGSTPQEGDIFSYYPTDGKKGLVAADATFVRKGEPAPRRENRQRDDRRDRRFRDARQ